MKSTKNYPCCPFNFRAPKLSTCKGNYTLKTQSSFFFFFLEFKGWKNTIAVPSTVTCGCTVFSNLFQPFLFYYLFFTLKPEENAEPNQRKRMTTIPPQRSKNNTRSMHTLMDVNSLSPKPYEFPPFLGIVETEQLPNEKLPGYETASIKHTECHDSRKKLMGNMKLI